MKNIIAFGGSTSKNSINKSLARYASSKLSNANVEFIDLSELEVPMFSVDVESELGAPPSDILELAKKIDNADGLIISLAEHNGSYATAFKNIYDWLSRIADRKTLGADTPLLLMASSPGGRGGASVLAAATDRFPRDGAKLIETYSLPRFGDNFDIESGEITDADKRNELLSKLKAFEASI